MRIRFARKLQMYSWFGFRIYIDDEKKTTLRFGDEYFFEGEITRNIRIRSMICQELIIPISILKEDNIIYLQNVQEFLFNYIQAIVTVDKTIVGVYESEKNL